MGLRFRHLKPNPIVNGGDNCGGAVYYAALAALSRSGGYPPDVPALHDRVMKQLHPFRPASTMCIARDRTGRERMDTLVRLLPMWPTEIADLSLSGRRHIVARLARALREERRRGTAGHWAYDLARHAQLGAVWRQESADLQQLLRSGVKRR